MVMKPRIEAGFAVAKPHKLCSRYPEGDVSCTLITAERRNT
jgi:hypothetical protein